MTTTIVIVLTDGTHRVLSFERTLSEQQVEIELRTREQMCAVAGARIVHAHVFTSFFSVRVWPLGESVVPINKTGRWSVVRDCCTSGNCVHCAVSSKPGGVVRLIQGSGYSEEYARFVARNWRRYNAVAVPPSGDAS